MISSPCKNCHRKNLPKDKCAKNCELLQSIQDIQALDKKNCNVSGIDCTEDSRYTIPPSITRHSVSFWNM